MRRRKPEVQPGDLDQRVTVKRITQTQDSYGNPTESESTVGTVRCMTEPARAQERVIADRERGVQTQRFTGRNIGTWKSVGTGDVLEWEGTRYNVRQAPNVGRAQYRTIEAEAGVET